jgi:2-polyprenyl-3-methyl-5-hydroxy-6-metoxy-1,4-benzoquinol methylase
MPANEPKTTILVDQYAGAASIKDVTGYNYKGLYIHAAPGLHEFVGERVAQFHARGEKVLDLGAGSGAMSLRLKDMGLEVTAADYVAENFRIAEEVPFIRLDLNADFSDDLQERFDGVVAVEIVEHLENPRHFLRQCWRVLKPGGRLVLTTPNVDNPVSKALFVRTGNFLWFADRDYRRDGHITPLMQRQLERCARELGFEQLYSGSYGDPFRHVTTWRNMRWLARMISWVSAPEQAGAGEIFAAIWGKPKT